MSSLCFSIVWFQGAGRATQGHPQAHSAWPGAEDAARLGWEGPDQEPTDGAHSFWPVPCLVPLASARSGQSLDLMLLDARLRPSFPSTGMLWIEWCPQSTEGPTPRPLTVTLLRNRAVVDVVSKDALALEQCGSISCSVVSDYL